MEAIGFVRGPMGTSGNGDHGARCHGEGSERFAWVK